MANGAPQDPPLDPVDPRIGRTLGRYLVEKRLGRGGMGVVYQARQLSLNRPVALKVLPPQMAADDEFRERFRREAHAVAALRHENIVHVYDIEEADGAYFLVMELVTGQTLRQLREARVVTPAEVRSLGIALARALGCAHRAGIVHRDVKSQNVMVTPEGIVKLMDFGIAWVADGGVKTATGHVLGTPESMAPEQALTGVASPRSDLYSLGVLLFELATGRLPFTGKEPFQIAYQHIHEPVPRPRSWAPEIPEELERVILHALEKDPERRSLSAAEIEADLTAVPVAGTATVPALPPAPRGDATAPTVLTPAGALGGTYSTVRWPDRRPPWLAVAMTGVVALGGGFLWWLARSAAPVGTAAGAPTSRPAVAPARPGPASPEPTTPAATPTATPAPARRPAKPAPEPPLEPVAKPAPEPPPELPVAAVYRCRTDVDFDIGPEEAVVVIEGEPIGPADDWDGSGGAGTWRPTTAVSRACFRLKGYRGTCVRIVLDPAASEETCEIDTELEEIE